MKRQAQVLRNMAASLAALSRKLEEFSDSLAANPVAAGKSTRGRLAFVPPAVSEGAEGEGNPGEGFAAQATTVLQLVYDVVRRSRNGASIARLREKTGLNARQLSNALYKLCKRGQIEAKARGIYIRKKSA
jgi:lambda repressor-like predicted transcriptional regulator